MYLPKIRNEEMSAKEFLHRIGGLGEKTPLMRIIQIRTESDQNTIKNWPQQLKKINFEWKIKKEKEKQSSPGFEDYKKKKNRELAKFFFDSAAEEEKEKFKSYRNKL